MSSNKALKASAWARQVKLCFPVPYACVCYLCFINASIGIPSHDDTREMNGCLDSSAGGNSRCQPRNL